jgi:hypothetical protein
MDEWMQAIRKIKHADTFRVSFRYQDLINDALSVPHLERWDFRRAPPPPTIH